MSTETLRDHYQATPDAATGGGWYHELGRRPGATATAVALACFVAKGDPIDHLDQALRFLRHHQHEDGGWATRTSGDVAVVEATAWVAWCLARARCELKPGAPDLRLAARWLERQQNVDGGWGSFRGSPSRTWLTCLALRALGLLDPHSQAVADGVGWLLDHRIAAETARVWGTGEGNPTITHTAFALVTLAELQPNDTGDHARAYRWLSGRVAADPGDLHRWIETYTVAPPGGHEWRLTLWHYGLPIAVSALLHHPDGPPAPVLGAAVDRLLRVPPGTHVWGDDAGGTAARLSLWSLWWSTQALSDVYRFPLFRRDDLIVWVRDAVIVRRGPARGRPLFLFLPSLWHEGVALLLRRYWAYLTVGFLAVVIAAGAVAGVWTWDVFWAGLIIPIVLIPLQEGFRRKGGG